jgi:hypothetical protein
MLNFVTFQKGHLDFFAANKGYEGEAEVYADYLDKLGMLAQAGTHLIDGKILYLSGYWEQVPGNWEVVIIPSIHVPQYPVSTVKDIRLWLKFIREQKQARRIQTWGEPNELIDRWLECLGFTCEGTMRQYSTDGDKRIWAKVW